MNGNEKKDDLSEDTVTKNIETSSAVVEFTSNTSTVVDEDESEKTQVLNFEENANLLTFPDGSQWTYITISQVEYDETLKAVVGLPEVSEEGKKNGEEPAKPQFILLSDGRIAQIQEPTDVCETVEGGGNTNSRSTVLAVIEETEEENTSTETKKRNKTHSCMEPGCARSYTSLHHLKVHTRNHTGDRPYPCTIEGCGKAFATDYSRKAHLRTHTGEKPYSCPYDETCSKSFKTSGDLQKHIRTHTGERPFLCPVEGCNRSFTTSNIRKVHIRTHTGERPYLCDYPGCERTFASSTNHKNHMRIHSGEKPFSCPVPNCLKRFTEYSSLYKHQLVHCQHKRYQCSFCHKTYRQLSTLTTHKRTVHGVISAEDGTELVLEQMIGLGHDGTKNFKNITSNLLNLKRDGNALIAIEEENDTSLFIVSQENHVDVLEFGEEPTLL